MMRVGVMAVMLVALTGCVTLDNLNPWAKKELPPPPVIAPAVEKIGPDVIAVPVEPVEQEDMLQAR